MKPRVFHIVLFLLLLVAATGVLRAGEPSGVPDADLDAVVQGNTQFALDLYKQLLEEGGNLLLSPYSISTALAMTYAGARGETEIQMADVLNFTLPQDRLHPAFGEIIGRLNDPAREGYELSTANRLWGQQGYNFLQPFLDTTRDHYGAELAELDFQHYPDQARQTINDWVATQTHEKIKDLLPPESIHSLTRLVLTNAIYFKSDWMNQFDPEFTSPAPFHVTSSESIDVPMMFQEAGYRYAELPDYQALEMPYVGDETSMLVLLPESADGLAGLEASLDGGLLQACIDQLEPTRMNVYFPKFTLESEFNLTKPLQSMGMTHAFIEGLADFSGIDGLGRLFISNVAHKTFMGVTEAGTEAAGGTAVVMDVTGMPPAFVADHPFLFIIRDVDTGSVLFMGRVVEPDWEVEKVSIPGDTNEDGVVDDCDASCLAANWQRSGTAWPDGDFNGDNEVTDADAAILATHWQEGAEGGAPIPEPSTPIALVSMAVVGVLIYAWRRHRCG